MSDEDDDEEMADAVADDEGDQPPPPPPAAQQQQQQQQAGSGGGFNLAIDDDDDVLSTSSSSEEEGDPAPPAPLVISLMHDGEEPWTTHPASPNRLSFCDPDAPCDFCERHIRFHDDATGVLYNPRQGCRFRPGCGTQGPRHKRAKVGSWC